MYGHDGAKNFFLVGAAAHAQAGDDRGRHVESPFYAFWIQRLAATFYRTPFFLGKLDVVENFGLVVLGDNGAYLGGGIVRSANLQGFHLFDKGGDKAVVEGAFDEDSAPTEANLALIGKGGLQRGAQHLIKVAIREDDIGVLAAQFQTQLLKHGGRDTGYARTRRRASRKGNHGHLWMTH